GSWCEVCVQGHQDEGDSDREDRSDHTPTEQPMVNDQLREFEPTQDQTEQKRCAPYDDRIRTSEQGCVQYGPEGIGQGRCYEIKGCGGVLLQKQPQHWPHNQVGCFQGSQQLG